MRNVSIVAFASTAALCLASIAACGDDGTERNTSSSGTNGSGASGGSTSSAGGGGNTTSTGGSDPCSGGAVCDPPAPAHPGVMTTIMTVTALVQDRNSMPAANITADVCGTNLCLFAETDAMGNLNVMQTGDLSDVRLLYGDGHDYVKMGAPLPPGSNPMVGTITAVRLPALSAGAAMPCLPGGISSDCGVCADSTVTHGDVTLDVAAMADVDYDGILYTENDQRTFRTVTFRGSEGTFPALDPSLNLEVYYATTPINTTICPAAKMTVPNSEGWAQGAAVEFYLHGTLTFSHWAPYGGWAKISEGTVSSDGMTVSTNDGEGIPVLGLIGVRLKP